MAGHARLAHDALFYGSDDQFVAALVPFVRDGLAQGQAVTAAVARPNITLLRDALGTSAEAVSFIDRDGWYERPAATVAGWQRLLEEASARGQDAVRLIGEVSFGAADRHPTWSRYESALNHVFADAPAWIVCPYDTRTLPAALLAEARRTHPTVFDSDRHHSDTYLPAEEFLRAVPEPMPQVAGAPALSVLIDGGVAAARHALRDLMVANGWSGLDRLDDLLIVASEIVSNSIRHGRGRRELRAWATAGAVACEVSDEGDGFSDPLVGYRPPDETLTAGRGLWIAQQLCDSLAVERQDGATRVRFALALPPTVPPPATCSPSTLPECPAPQPADPASRDGVSASQHGVSASQDGVPASQPRPPFPHLAHPPD